IIISHDRYFLNRMVTQVAELDRGQLTLYTGDYDHYVTQRQEDRARLLKAAEQQRKEIAQLERFVERFKAKATKAKQAQSRLKQLEKIDRIEIQSEGNTIHFNFPQPPRSGKMVMELTGIRKAYGDNVIYDGLDFTIERGERVALVGPNGAGKSTLLKILAGATPIQGGEVTVGHNVTIQHFAQHQVEALDLRATILEEMVRAATDESLTELRSILGAFLFTGDDVNKRVSVLSGGEKSRLAMARLLLKPANLLLLDEPTNHLDIASRDVLEGAMNRFEGTICFISHDRHFISALANRIVHIDPGVQTEYLGDFAYYQWKRKEEAETRAQVQAEADGGSSGGTGGGHLSRKELKRRRAELRKQKSAEVGDRSTRVADMEAQVEALEMEKSEIEALMADPALYEDGSRVASLSSRMAAIDTELETLYLDWETLAAELEAIESRYRALEAELEGA
ncbi:MAG: ATP-binding cassette domain-containing protein, partial [Myxococcota bacterium]